MNIPYKYRGIALLLLLAVVLPWGAWRYALGDTLRTWLECRRSAAQLSLIASSTGSDAPEVPDGRELVLSGALLEVIGVADSESAVRVTGYEPLVTEQQDRVCVHTAQLTLTGSYPDLLRVVERIEHTPCRLRSMGWKCVTEPLTRRRQLAVTLYVQQIVTKNRLL